MPDLQISVEPTGTDRYAIFITGMAITGTKMIHGQDPLGYTEAELRSPDGLPKCGLTQIQIDRAISAAKDKR